MHTIRACSGLGAIELVVTLSILAILLTLAAPRMSQTLERQRLTGTTHSLLNALHQARSEAVKRNHRVTLCPSQDGEWCREDGEWSEGWILFADTGSTGQRQPDDELIAYQALATGASITPNQPVEHYVSYVARGTTRRTSGALQMGSLWVCVEGRGRRVIVSSVGRPRSEPASC